MKKLVKVIFPLVSDGYLSILIYDKIIKNYSPSCKCAKKIGTLSYYGLCRLSKDLDYTVTIIQDDKIFDTKLNNRLEGEGFQHISACYQINPFSRALVIAQSTYDHKLKIFFYEPYAFDKAIVLPNLSSFKYLFDYFNVYKLDGSLAKDLNELTKENEVIAISKQHLTYEFDRKNYPIRIILRWYRGLA